MKVKTTVTAAVLMAVACTTFAADWPQWQGPDRNAISREQGLLQEWPQEGPPLAWRIDTLGGGDGAPAIADGRIFLMSNRDDEEVVLALSEKDGSEIWAAPLGSAFAQRPSQSREGPACTPTVDGDRLYVIGMGGHVACLQVKDGKILWQISMAEKFSGRLPMWSYRESPLVDGEKLICTPGGPDATLVALNKLTGETIWKSKVPDAPSGNGDSPAGRPPSERQASRPAERTGGSSDADRSRSRPVTGAGGSTVTITGTKDPSLFISEHWGMSAFSKKLPNGKYLAKLYFAETYSGITGPGQRVFSFAVQGHEFKDFDIWVKAGGFQRATIETIPVDVTNGEFRIVFTPKVENPAIKAIEVVPEAGVASSTNTIRVNAGAPQPFTDSKNQVWQPDSGFEGGMTNPGTVNSGGGSGGRRGGFGSRGTGAAYASVIAIDFEGQRQYVQLISNALVGVAASDGTFLWRYDKPANRMGINCSTPLYHDGMVFAASAYGAGGGLVKLSKGSDEAVKAEEIYATTDMQNHHGGMILLDGYLYGANGGNSGGALACLDFKTGKVMWDQRESAGRRAKGSLALADGRLYYRMEDGTVLLIEPDPKQYIERGRFEQPDRRKPPAWAHPVIANGRLYVRDQDQLFCYDVKEK
jgi:alcohol dehydrogenase (cytochrome c)